MLVLASLPWYLRLWPSHCFIFLSKMTYWGVDLSLIHMLDWKIRFMMFGTFMDVIPKMKLHILGDKKLFNIFQVCT